MTKIVLLIMNTKFKSGFCVKDLQQKIYIWLEALNIAKLELQKFE